MWVILVTGTPAMEEWERVSHAPEGVRFARVENLRRLEALTERSPPDVLVFDLDRVPLDDRRVRDLKRSFPDTEILVVSGRFCHPELKESMGRRIFACLSKPLDLEEFEFCLKSIHEKKRPAASGPSEVERL